jgi:phosphoribosylglycinamide formyltransferase-1
MYGMNVHKAVFENKELISGATIHLVDEEYDRGKLLNQMSVEINPNDSPEVIAEKVLKIEHILYYSTIRQIELGNIIL